MDKIKKILAPTDFSELSQVGIRYALDWAKEAGAEVTVYHTVSYDEITQIFGGDVGEKTIPNNTLRPSDHLQKYQLALSRFLKDHFSDLVQRVKIREKVEFGKPDKNIVEEASKEGTDLIVISTHGRTGLSHMLLGSVTEKVVRHAPCPVLSIHPRLGEKAAQRAAAVA